VTTGKGTLIGVRMLDAPLAQLDAWIERQNEPDLTRPEAMRRLIVLGLSVSEFPEDAKKERRSIEHPMDEVLHMIARLKGGSSDREIFGEIAASLERTLKKSA
jgi:hypothetical protein